MAGGSEWETRAIGDSANLSASSCQRNERRREGYVRRRRRRSLGSLVSPSVGRRLRRVPLRSRIQRRLWEFRGALWMRTQHPGNDPDGAGNKPLTLPPLVGRLLNSVK